MLRNGEPNPMHPDEAALLRTVIEQPEDDAPRLVYADWIEEQGRVERAEFIRLQCELERTPPSAQRVELTARTDALWDARKDEWMAELPRIPGVNWPHQFRRGFAHRVDFDHGDSFVEHQDVIFAAAPIESVTMSRAAISDVEAIAESPHAVKLRELSFLFSHIGHAGVFVLATEARLRKLRHLYLAGNAIRDAGAQHLANSICLSGLESLVLSRNQIGEAGGLALAASHTLSRFLKLYVRDNPLDADTLSRLRVRFPRLVT